MQHIVIITTSYPDKSEGTAAAGSFVQDFATALSKQARVTVIAPSEASSVTTSGNITLQRFAVARQPLSLLKASDPRDWKNIATTLRSGQSCVSRVVNKEAPDYLFALWTLPSGYWARVAAKRLNIDYGIWALGSDIWSLGKIPIIRSVLAKTIQRSAHQFADGIQLANDVKQLSGTPCEFLPSTREFPQNHQRTYASSPPYRLGFLGRWHPNKGIDILLAALEKLTQDDWSRIEDVRIFGGGPMQLEVEEKVTHLHANGRPVSLGGFLNKQEAAQFLFSCDYALIPSRIESIPVIFSDCLKARCGIIATPVGDLPELMERFPIGICADEVNSAGLASAIGKALTRPPSGFSTGIEDAVKVFDINASVKTLLEAIGHRRMPTV